MSRNDVLCVLLYCHLSHHLMMWHQFLISIPDIFITLRLGRHFKDPRRSPQTNGWTFCKSPRDASTSVVHGYKLNLPPYCNMTASAVSAVLFFRRIFLLLPSMMKCFLHLILACLHDNYRSLRISEIDNLNSVYSPQNLCKYHFFVLKIAKLHLDLFHHNISEMIIKL